MRRLLPALLLIATLWSWRGVSAQGITGPAQPADGPGGSAYRYARVAGEHHGEQPTGYWLFEPVVGETDDASYPVVILLHGFTAVDPMYLRPWIDHIVRKGRVVIFPDYQVDNPLGESPLEYTGNMIDGVTAALTELGSGKHVATRLDDLTVAGYSMGGVLALDYAAMADSLGLPAPTALMVVTPGGCSGCGGPGDDSFGVPYRDLSRIDPNTKMLVIVGENDDFVGSRPAEIAWEETGQIPAENRDYLIARSDDHGEPVLVADHTFPSNAGETARVDGLDWYGTFKWLDGLIGCAADASVCELTMNGGPIELDMGRWSDGMPVAPALNIEAP